MTRLALLVLAGAFAASAGAAPPVKSETATSGDVQATISWRMVKGEGGFRVRILVTRAGRRVLDERVPPLPRDHVGAVWPGVFGGRKSVVVKDLDGDAEPEIVLDVHWGGVHCCWWSRVYRWREDLEKYVPIHHFWGDGAYRLADLDEDRLQEFVTADTRFAYAFSSFAESSFPLQVWTYRSGRFIDTTRDYPGLIREDAAKQWRWRVVAHRKHWNELGVLAAWTADQCLLGRGDEAFARLRRLIAAGALGDDGWGSLAGYVPKLRTFLQRNGYSCRGKT